MCDMFATNRVAQGAGLAAPQIGVNLAVFIFNCLDAHGGRHQGVVCNPLIALHPEPTMDIDYEGCLSLPGAHLPVARPDFAVCRGQDQFGRSVAIRGTGTLARCLQHETDHLNGMVMADHLTPGDRRDLWRQHAEVTAQYPAGWPAGDGR